jgi:activator of HSP90 ATPase
MPRTIEQNIALPASAEKLFDMYMSPETHEAITGSPVIIGSKAGSRFKAFNGMIHGRTLMVVPNYMIVQSWRGKNWQTDEFDSILILTFQADGDHGRIHMVHANVADSDFDGVRAGWEKFYWKPWKAYLEKEKQDQRKMHVRAA